MHSHHSHSGQFCTHAVGQLEECIEEAIRQKFTLFCLTEHIPRYREEDIYPGEDTSLIKLMDSFRDYHELARQMQLKYSPQITIFVGLESEFIRAVDLRILELLIAKYPIDFMVGSVHHVNSIPIDFDKAKWNEALASCHDEEEFYKKYFDHQYEVIKKFQPLVIGHFDVVLLFAPEATDVLKYNSVKDKITRNIEYVTAYGGMFELNSAAFRKGWSTAYPKPDIVQLIKAAEGRFCISDDSHGPLQVGLNYDRMQQYVRQLDIKLSNLALLEDILVVESKESCTDQFLQWTTRTL